MEQVKKSQKNTIPLSFMMKIKEIIKSNNSNNISWLKNRRGFIVKSINNIQQNLYSIFHMKYKSFQRYAKMVGFKVRKGRKGQVYRHNVLDNKQKTKPHTEEISLQMKLDEDYHETSKKVKQSLLQAQSKRQQLVRVFKGRYQRCDKLIDNIVYSLLIAHKENTIDQDSILNQITQIQDLFAQNQQKLKNCVWFLSSQASNQQKISNHHSNQEKGTNNNPELKFSTTGEIKFQTLEK